jgi:hypothetical protein
MTSGSTLPVRLNANHLKNGIAATYSRVLIPADASGSVWPAGAAPGLQNRGTDAVTIKSEAGLRHSAPAVTAHWQRAESNDRALDPDLAAVVDAWPRLPEAVRAGIVAMVKAASGDR